MLEDHVMYTTGYCSTQLVIIKHIAIQSAPLLAQKLEQWLAEIITMNFSKWKTRMVEVYAVNYFHCILIFILYSLNW